METAEDGEEYDSDGNLLDESRYLEEKRTRR
jgi:hypothetical protein